MAKHKSKPGKGKTWTLRVERFAPKARTQLPDGATETIYAGWEATPNRFVGNPSARYV